MERMRTGPTDVGMAESRMQYYYELETHQSLSHCPPATERHCTRYEPPPPFLFIFNSMYMLLYHSSAYWVAWAYRRWWEASRYL